MEMEPMNLTNKDLITALTRIVECIQFTERISKQPCCNSCTQLKECEYKPDWGQPTRINCPFWKGKE